MDKIWYLEGFEARSKKILKTAVRSLPFTVGRRSSCDLSLDSLMVSQRHAEISERGGSLWVRDLGSTNGTFVNGERVRTGRSLGDGDILHFGDLEFRLVRPRAEQAPFQSMAGTLSLSDKDLPNGWIAYYRELREILQLGAVQALFQPLVRLADGAVRAFEALGRGDLETAPRSPGELFEAAETIGLAPELSVAFRNKGIAEARHLPPGAKIFLNTHPAELADHAALLASLAPLASVPDLEFVLEIHESTVADAASLQGLRRGLDRLGVGIAFDDFGKGQARIVELTEASPNYLKFDTVFVRGIHRAASKRQDMVRTLVGLAREMGIVVIAEGVECREEAEACLALGFEYGQGYFLGRPRPAPAFAREDLDTWADVDADDR